MIKITSDMYLRAVCERGNLARLKGVMRRAENGERIVVGALGGSITEGARAATREGRWASLNVKWWRESFPKAEIVEANAGIGATGSAIGIFRLEADLLSKKPDVVIVEYAVNDFSGPEEVNRAETLEAIIRRLLKAGVAVISMMLPRDSHTDYSPYHKPVGHHYGIPILSVSDALYPRLDDGTLVWSDYGADGVHPNPDGHVFIAALIAEFLESVRIDRREEVDAPLAEPIYGELYESAKMLDNSYVPSSLGGFEARDDLFRQFPNGWVATEPCEPFVFEGDCRVLMLMLRRSVRDGYGKCRIIVDCDGEVSETVIDCAFPGGWGDYALVKPLLRSESPKHIRVTVEAVDGMVEILRIMEA